jgi:hypothetical protein
MDPIDAEASRDPSGADGSSLNAAAREPIVGRDAIMAYVSRGLGTRLRSAHAGFMPEIEFQSETSAKPCSEASSRHLIAAAHRMDYRHIQFES